MNHKEENTAESSYEEYLKKCESRETEQKQCDELRKLRADEYLKSIGYKISGVRDVQAGDVIGIQNKYQPGQIRLYCAQIACTKPVPPHLLPPKPYVRFYPTHIGFCINEKGEIHGFHYLSIVEQSSQYKYGFSDETTDTEYLEWMGEDLASDLIKSEKESTEEDKYLITDLRFKKLGSVIPSTTLPSMGVLPQSRLRNVDDLFELAKSLESDFEELKRILANIENKCRIYGA